MENIAVNNFAIRGHEVNTLISAYDFAKKHYQTVVNAKYNLTEATKTEKALFSLLLTMVNGKFNPSIFNEFTSELDDLSDPTGTLVKLLEVLSEIKDSNPKIEFENFEQAIWDVIGSNFQESSLGILDVGLGIGAGIGIYSLAKKYLFANSDELEVKPIDVIVDPISQPSDNGNLAIGTCCLVAFIALGMMTRSLKSRSRVRAGVLPPPTTSSTSSSRRTVLPPTTSSSSSSSIVAPRLIAAKKAPKMRVWSIASSLNQLSQPKPTYDSRTSTVPYSRKVPYYYRASTIPYSRKVPIERFTNENVSTITGDAKTSLISLMKTKAKIARLERES